MVFDFTGFIVHLPWFNIFGTVILIVLLSFLRYVLNRAIRANKEVLTKPQRKWISRVKNIYWMILLIGTIMIWAPQIQTVALSLVAFTVALVIATKEMILCIVGSFVRVSARPFELGDWIEVDGIIGEVSDSNLFSFEVLEFDVKHGSFEYTGRAHNIPNSKVLTHNITNQNIFRSLVSLDFQLTIGQYDGDFKELLTYLNQVTETTFKPYEEVISRSIKREKRKTGLPLQDVVYLIGIDTSNLGHVFFWVKAFAPSSEALNIKNAITKDFLTHVSACRRKIQEEKDRYKDKEKDKKEKTVKRKSSKK